MEKLDSLFENVSVLSENEQGELEGGYASLDLMEGIDSPFQPQNRFQCHCVNINC